jgi:hypothetical protein
MYLGCLHEICAFSEQESISSGPSYHALGAIFVERNVPHSKLTEKTTGQHFPLHMAGLAMASSALGHPESSRPAYKGFFVF